MEIDSPSKAIKVESSLTLESSVVTSDINTSKESEHASSFDINKKIKEENECEITLKGDEINLKNNHNNNNDQNQCNFETVIISDTNLTNQFKLTANKALKRDLTRFNRIKQSLNKAAYHKTAYHMVFPLFQQVCKERFQDYSVVPKQGSLHAVNNVHVHVQTPHYAMLNKLIKEYMLTQQFNRLSMLMLPLCQIPRQFPELLCKLGNFLLHTSSKSQTSKSTFNNLMKILFYHDGKPEFYTHMALDVLQKQQDIQEAYQILTNVISKDIFSDNVYFSMFYGNLEYLQWKSEMKIQEKLKDMKSFNNNVSQWNEEEDDDVIDTKEDVDRSKYSYHGERAITYLKPCTERLATNDLSLLHYAELVDYFHGREEWMDVFKIHLKNNPTNPTAYKFALRALEESDDRTVKQERLKVLENYAGIDPTSASVEELIIYYRKQGEHFKVLSLLTLRLSHQHLYKHSMFDWKILSELFNSMNDDQVDEFIKEVKQNLPSWLVCLPKIIHDDISNDVIMKYMRNISEIIGSPMITATPMTTATPMITATPMTTATPMITASHNETIAQPNEYCQNILSLNQSFDYEYEQVSSPELILLDDVCSSDDEDAVCLSPLNLTVMENDSIFITQLASHSKLYTPSLVKNENFVKTEYGAVSSASSMSASDSEIQCKKQKRHTKERPEKQCKKQKRHTKKLTKEKNKPTTLERNNMLKNKISIPRKRKIDKSNEEIVKTKIKSSLKQKPVKRKRMKKRGMVKLKYGTCSDTSSTESTVEDESNSGISNGDKSTSRGNNNNFLESKLSRPRKRKVVTPSFKRFSTITPHRISTITPHQNRTPHENINHALLTPHKSLFDISENNHSNILTPAQPNQFNLLNTVSIELKPLSQNEITKKINNIRTSTDLNLNKIDKINHAIPNTNEEKHIPEENRIPDLVTNTNEKKHIPDLVAKPYYNPHNSPPKPYSRTIKQNNNRLKKFTSKSSSQSSLKRMIELKLKRDRLKPAQQNLSPSIEIQSKTENEVTSPEMYSPFTKRAKRLHNSNDT